MKDTNYGLIYDIVENSYRFGGIYRQCLVEMQPHSISIGRSLTGRSVIGYNHARFEFKFSTYL